MTRVGHHHQQIQPLLRSNLKGTLVRTTHNVLSTRTQVNNHVGSFCEVACGSGAARVEASSCASLLGLLLYLLQGYFVLLFDFRTRVFLLSVQQVSL
jgi:hypothetical protein